MSNKRENGMIIHLVLIVLYIVWVIIISSVLGYEKFNEHYNTPCLIILGILCTSVTIHGLYLLITEK